jgi:hypothetical protein
MKSGQLKASSAFVLKMCGYISQLAIVKYVSYWPIENGQYRLNGESLRRLSAGGWRQLANGNNRRKSIFSNGIGINGVNVAKWRNGVAAVASMASISVWFGLVYQWRSISGGENPTASQQHSWPSSGENTMPGMSLIEAEGINNNGVMAASY